MADRRRATTPQHPLPRSRRDQLLARLEGDPWSRDRWPTGAGWATVAMVLAVLAGLGAVAAVRAAPTRDRAAATTVPGRTYAGVTVERRAAAPRAASSVPPLGAQAGAPLPLPSLTGPADGWQDLGPSVLVARPTDGRTRWRAAPGARAVGARIGPAIDEPGLGIGPAVRLAGGDTWLLARTSRSQARLLWVREGADQRPPLVVATYDVGPDDLAAGLALEPDGTRVQVLLGGVVVTEATPPRDHPARAVGFAALPARPGGSRGAELNDLVRAP